MGDVGVEPSGVSGKNAETFWTRRGSAGGAYLFSSFRSLYFSIRFVGFCFIYVCVCARAFACVRVYMYVSSPPPPPLLLLLFFVVVLGGGGVIWNRLWRHCPPPNLTLGIGV